MKRAFTSAVVVILLVAVATWAHAWPSTALQSTGTTDTLLVAPSYTGSGLFVYTYDLTNQTAQEYITGFSLTFPTAIPVTSFTAITAPEGWEGVIRTITNKVEYRLIGLDSFSLGPSETKTFGFTSSNGPGTQPIVFASSQDSYGWSGMTYGPAVPEPGSILAMMTGLIGLAGLKLRRK